MRRPNRSGLRVYLFSIVAICSIGTHASLSQTRLYVELSQPSDQKQSSDRLREATVRLLRYSNITIAANAAEAERILSVTNQIYIKGYLSRNPRVRYRNSDSRPVYAGYVAVELKDPKDEVVWSYLLTP